MKKKGFWFFGVLMVLPAMGLVLTGCPNDTTGEQDTWSNVTSLDQINGTWKGSYSQTMTIKEVMENEGETWNDQMQEMFGDIKIAVTAEITMIIDSEAKTSTETMRMTQTYSGGSIDMMWAVISSASISEDPEVEVDDSKHSLTTDIDFPPTPIADSDFADVQIDQNGTKIKVPAGTIGDNPEMVFNKQ
jgi:hypothetical protein